MAICYICLANNLKPEMELNMSATTAVDPIAAAIAQAQAAAANLAAAQAAGAGAVAVVPQTTTAVAPLRPGAPLSMDDMGGGMSVDGWLGVKEFGFVGGAKKDLLSNKVIQVEIDLSAVAPNFAIKFGNNPVTYYKTYDRVFEARGGSWADAVAKAQRAAPGAREYPSADVPMTLLEDLKTVGGETAQPSGTSIGYSIATTGWGNWKKFYQECIRLGLVGHTVRVELGFEKREGNGNKWGIINYKLVPAA